MMTLLRLILALTTIYKYHIYQMDVITAFLNGTLHEEIYITQPEGYIKYGTAYQVCRLLKSLYGLKHASHVWYETFDTFLISQGFLKCTSNLNFYIKQSTI